MTNNRMPYLTKHYPRGSRTPVYKLHKPGLSREIYLSPEELHHLGVEIEKVEAGDLK